MENCDINGNKTMLLLPKSRRFSQRRLIHEKYSISEKNINRKHFKYRCYYNSVKVSLTFLVFNDYFTYYIFHRSTNTVYKLVEFVNTSVLINEIPVMCYVSYLK